MEMTKQRKMLIGVLCLGVGGLMIDRLFLSSPDSAVAEQDEVIEIAADASTSPLASVPGSAQPQQTPPRDAKALPTFASLTERLLLAQQQQAEHQNSGREDPFAVPDQWQTDQPKALINSQETVAPTKRRITSLFKLDGTVRSLNEGNEELLAVISGGGLDGVAIRVKQRVRVPDNGGQHEDYELVEVGSRYVVWMSLRTQERITMRVEQDY